MSETCPKCKVFQRLPTFTCHHEWHYEKSADKLSAEDFYNEWAETPFAINLWQLYGPDEPSSYYLPFATAYASLVSRSERERAEAAESHIKRIIETINLLPSVTGLFPVSRPEDAWMAIRELQEAYGDAARARNGEAGPLLRRQAEQHKKEIAAERERADRAERLLHNLTPGGSEFVDDPKRCFDFVQARLLTTAKIVIERNEALAEVERLRKELAEIKEHCISEHDCSFCKFEDWAGGQREGS